MLIVHALLSDGRFAVWGEVPADPEQPAPFSPFDAGWRRLRDALSGLLPEQNIPTSADPLDVWLPTAAGKPVASNPLLAPPPATTNVQLQHWQVVAIRFPMATALDLLARCVNRTTLGQGIIIGSSLAYWAEVLRFAGQLVYRDSYLPGLKQTDHTWYATWQAVIMGEEAHRFARLATAMPGAARCAGSKNQPPSTAPSVVLAESINLMVDALVRSSSFLPTTSQESIHDRWLAGLFTVKGRLAGNASEWDALARQFAEWSAPIRQESASFFRLCVRLEEPSSESEAWILRYLLQANDDPSLLIPVEQAWQPTRTIRQAFERRRFTPREYLLTSLGQAARVCPPIEASLRTAEPGECELDINGAYAFLTETAWLLEQAGIGVMLPAWWTGTKRRFTSSASVKSPMKTPSNLSLDAIVNVEWRVMLGDQHVTLEELQQLAQLKTPLIQFRGEWMHVNAEQIHAALESLKKKSKTTVRELVRTSLGVSTDDGLDVSDVKATGWVGRLLDELHEATFEERAVPAGFQGQLRPYQIRGYSWLAFLRRWGFGACLADDMGLGKTIQTLALLQAAWEEQPRPTLLVCPTSVLGNWEREAARFVPDLPVHLHHGSNRLTGAAFTRMAKKTGLILTSYGLLHRDAELLNKVKWSACILDEAQNIKNPETKQARTARSMVADFKVALTGTPVENHVADLWSIMEYLNPGLLGTQANFRRRYFLPIQAKQDAQAATRLKQVTGPFILRRLKTDKSIIADLPDKIEMKVFCRLTKEQATLYAATVNDATKAIKGAGGIQRKGMVLALLLRLKQLCNHPAQMLADGSPLGQRSGKLNRLAEMLEEIAESNDKVLLFSQFTDMGMRLQQFAQDQFGKEVLFLHGGTSRPMRDAMVKRFQAADGPRIFVLSLKAGGTGLNLTAANHVIHFDRWWNPAVENQATDRAFRIGQQRKVMVHKFVCIGTVEEKIDAMIEAKSAVAGKVVGTGENWLTELSDRDLHDILTLSPDAVEE